MQQQLVTVTPPAAEPVMLAEVKAWAKIDGSTEDAMIASMLTAAIESAEQYLKRPLITRTLKLTLDVGRSNINDALGDGVYDLPVSILSGCLPRYIKLPFAPIQSITSVVTYGTAGNATAYSNSNYYLNGDKLTLNDSAYWPSDLRDYKTVEITYVAGYGDTSSAVPAGIKAAIQMHTQRMYDERIICEMPEGCMALLRQYRVYDL